MIKELLATIFPPRCPFCGTILSNEETTCCSSCQKHLKPIPEKRCIKCGTPFMVPHSLPVCINCRTDKYVFQKVYSPFLYEDKPRSGVLRLKFYGKRSAAQPLSEYLYDFIQKEGVPTIDYITAVPIDKKRLKERGYNQSELIAKSLAKKFHLPYVKLLKKKEGITRQSTLSRSGRKKNVRGAFSCIGKIDIKGKHILLVDDIYTTGATVGECARILRRGGAKEVNVATAALTCWKN